MTLPPKAARPKNKHFHETVWFFGLGTTTGLPKTTWPKDHFGIPPAQLLLLSGPGHAQDLPSGSIIRCSSVFWVAWGTKAKNPHVFRKEWFLGLPPSAARPTQHQFPTNVGFCSPWYPRPPKNHLAKNTLRGPFDRSLDQDLTSGTITRCFGELPPPQSARGPPGCRLAGWRRWGPRTKC